MLLEKNSVREFKLGMYGETFSPIDTERSYRVEIDLYGLTRKKDQEKRKKQKATQQANKVKKKQVAQKRDSLLDGNLTSTN